MLAMPAYLLALLLVPFLHAASSGSQPCAAQKGVPTSGSDFQRHEPAADVRPGPEGDIKRLLVSQVDAWNHGQLEVFMQGYWQSPDLTFFSGASITKGWEPTFLRYRQRYQAENKEMGKLEFQDLRIDLLSRKAAVVTGKWQLTMSDGKQPHGLFTLIMKRMPGGWRIVHDHTSSE
jgi:ketosteroid isomerase-like protein